MLYPWMLCSALSIRPMHVQPFNALGVRPAGGGHAPQGLCGLGLSRLSSACLGSGSASKPTFTSNTL